MPTSAARAAKWIVPALVCVSSAARADEKDACATAAENAQLLQRQGKLLAARERALVCTRPVCPPVVKQDCDALLSTLELTIPSLVVGARDEAGNDVVGASVTLDGVRVDVQAGKAIEVDPGVHALHAEAAGRTPTDQRIVVREGERARPVVLTLPSPARPKKEPPPPPPPVVVAPSPREPQTSPFVWIFGTLSAVSVVAFAGFEIEAVSDATHLRHSCAPRCSDDDVSRVRTESTLGWVSAAAAVAFAGGALAVVWLDRPARSGVAITPGGVAGRF